MDIAAKIIIMEMAIMAKKTKLIALILEVNILVEFELITSYSVHPIVFFLQRK